MGLLVVEDDPQIARMTALFLREEGYSVDTAESGSDGLSKAFALEYDAILLDTTLPDRDGLALLGDLRRKNLKTPVIILSDGNDVAERVRGLDAGADDFLNKPFDLSELAARIRALIRRSAGRSQPVIIIGNVSINTVSRKVSVNGVAVKLSNKEYSLIELLAIHRGELVTRAKISRKLFGELEDDDSNRIGVYICNIRRKVTRELITTRKGMGFIIDR